MRSAVRLFCFLIGMVFQQIPPLLLHEFLLLVLITCMGSHFQRGKLYRITQGCGNKRFTASDDSGVGGVLESNQTRKGR